MSELDIEYCIKKVSNFNDELNCNNIQDVLLKTTKLTSSSVITGRANNMKIFRSNNVSYFQKGQYSTKFPECS